jgi:hypothetical protein
MLSSNTSAVSESTAYVENVFSTYLYDGTSASQTITNNIDLAGKGGLTWIKSRNGSGAAKNHRLWTTDLGGNKVLQSNLTDAAYTYGSNQVTFGSTGVTLSSDAGINESGYTYASWTFRKQPKFFDVVTYTGTGGAQTVAHNLGSAPGFMIVKRTDTSSDWVCYHQGLGAQYRMILNTTAGQVNSGYESYWGDGATYVAPTSTVFSVGDATAVNASGGTFVAYLFASDAGGFGLTGTDSVINCGYYIIGSGGVGPDVTLGYEPQFLMVKNATNLGNWIILDNMRGLDNSNDAFIYPNTSGAEVGVSSATYWKPTATGFSTGTGKTTGDVWIYIAIRRGPMKVPTDATKVFAPVVVSAPTTNQVVTTNFPVDMCWSNAKQSTSYGTIDLDRLRGSSTSSNQLLQTHSTSAEGSNSGWGIGLQSNTSIVDNMWNSTLGYDAGGVVYWNFRRAPSFFDEVCFTSTSNTSMTLNHNLGVVPQMMIKKARATNGTSNSWRVYHIGLNGGVTPENCVIRLDASGAQTTSTPDWNYVAPTSTQFTAGYVESDIAFVTYLFATCPGVSKVGSYTGTGTTKQIDCGFAAGARFVLIKRTDSSGDWYVWDTARGIVSGNDPYLLLNSTAAEVTSTDYIDTYSAGFELSSTAPAALNASGGSYIFLAIA